MMFDIAFGIVFGFIGIVLLIAGLGASGIAAVGLYEFYKRHKPAVFAAISVMALFVIVVRWATLGL